MLLIVREGGIDDRLVRQLGGRLSATRAWRSSSPGANEIARYSRITQGVGVSQVPALVVVRPRRLSGIGARRHSVSYGFRNSQAVVQAVHDALYSGKDNLPTARGEAVPMRELPDYLRPLPGPNEGSGQRREAAAPEHPQPEDSGTPGLIRADAAAGHSGGFITDAIVDLGYATREQVDAGDHRSPATAGRRPEEILHRAGGDRRRAALPSDRRALRARLRRPRRSSTSTWAPRT